MVSYSYNAWGKVESVTGTMADTVGQKNPLRYRGYYYDGETGFYYLTSRYYDPEVGRFINADSAIAGVGGDIRGYNMFSYCFNNPVNMSDFTGNWPKLTGKIGNAINKLVNKILNETTSATASTQKATANKLPPTGEPGTSETLKNPDGTPKQKRWYGPDGNAVRDRDYNHPGDVPFPHDHEWANGKRGKQHLPPSPEYEFSIEPVVGTVIVTVCVIGIAITAVDDLTGVGVADDFLFAPLGTGLSQGLIMIFGQ